jgi:hypothetical protein
MTTSTATATVTDQFGNPVSGDSVAFTSSGSQSIGSATAGSSLGTYQATITSSTTVGQYKITATDSSVSPSVSGTAPLTQTVGPAALVSVALGPESAVGDGTFTSTATATVTDAFGNPVSGDSVAFTSSGGQSIGPVNAGSSPGAYQTTVTSTTAGSFTITATDSSVSPSVSGTATYFESQPLYTIGPRQTISVTNTLARPMGAPSFSTGGADPDDFIVTSSTCGTYVVVGASCSVNVRFAPSDTGARSAMLVEYDVNNGPNNLVVGLTLMEVRLSRVNHRMPAGGRASCRLEGRQVWLVRDARSDSYARVHGLATRLRRTGFRRESPAV